MLTRVGLIMAMGVSVVQAGQIAWRGGAETTIFKPAAVVAEDLANLAGENGAAVRHVVVQFDQPLGKAQRARLAGSGVTLLDYLGEHAYYAALGPIDVAGLAEVASLRVALPLRRSWKLHPSLERDEVLPWAVVNADQAAYEQALASGQLPETPPAEANPRVAVYVLFHSDVPSRTDGVQVLQRHQGVVQSFIASLNGAVVQLPYRSIKPLAGEDVVAYIEPPLPKMSHLNAGNRAVTGADTAQALPYSLDGSGVNVLVYDGGSVLATHTDFGGRVRIGDGDGLSDHATHVAGTIGGAGTNSSGTHRGMAPGVDIQSYGFETDGPLEAGFLYTDPGDIEADYHDAINVWGADIANNSIGTNIAPNGFPCEWTGDYDVTSALIDAIVRGSLGAPFRIVWANGNERQSSNCGTTYHSTAPPAGAKNHITVGALNSNDDSVTSFTSWGPVDDGRIKPDLAAPGCQNGGDNGVTSCSSSGNYTTKCGTSMASPTVCGLSALLLQDFRIHYPGEPDFRNATLKALLAHTAADIENTGPDFKTGYGSVRVVPAIAQLRSGDFFEGEVDQGETVQVLVVVGPGKAPIKVTLAWDDVPAAPAVDPVLVNDLDLVVLDVASNAHYPWTLDPLNPANLAVRTQADHVNNIEQVVIDAAESGPYFVNVTGFNVPVGPQTFSLVASPSLINCSPRGQVSLDRIAYPCSATAEVVVIDCDLNTTDTLVETVTVQVASATEPAGEMLVLTETGPETARFVGSIDVATSDAPGLLAVTEGDLVTAAYLDADDGMGGTNGIVTASSPVDCTPPVTGNVKAVNLDARNATITFDTNEPASARILYGLACDMLTDVASAPGLNTLHAVALSPLLDDTPYFFGIEIEDAAGNVNFDTNGGVCYSFVTPEIPDFFTQQFQGDFNLARSALLFAPNGSIDFYSACRYETLVLPTDPTGGTTVDLADTGSATINLAGGNQILLYGGSYDTLHINANGNITFATADSDSTESYEDHFDQPRVSVLFDDLDPSENGTVSYKLLADRVAVTWFDVPEDNGNNANTFQVECYYDGRIQFAWLDIDAQDCLVGLSAGLGVDPDFLASDLSGLVDCGPRPPSAAGRTVVLGEDRTAAIELFASDDGTPGPLAFLITALPAYALRDAGNDHLIIADELPYALVGGGNVVWYTPTNGFLGQDSFAFKVNDGGFSPDGGDSNAATIICQVDPVLLPPFFDSFLNLAFDTTAWFEIRGAEIDDRGLNEPSAPYSARFNGNPSGQDAITSHLIDAATQSGLRMVFQWQRTGGGESPDAGDNFVAEFLDLDGSWQVLAEFAGDGPDMTTFAQSDTLLPASALHDSLRIRFRSNGTAGSSILDDWFLDDVLLTNGDAPLAIGSIEVVAQNTPRSIILDANDPNQDPLTYRIVALPANGTLTDPGAGVIDPGDLPYALANGGNAVMYAPGLDFAGSDTLRFQVDDGLYDSNIAVVSLQVEPILVVPFLDTFPADAFDAMKWAVVAGAEIVDAGPSQPSPPLSAHLDGSPSGGDQFQTFDIDLAGESNLDVRFAWMRTGAGDSPETGEDLVVDYLNQDGFWTLLVSFLGDGPDMDTFSQSVLPLPPNAYHAAFRLRFSNSATTGDFDDWFVDNIEVVSPNTPTAVDQSLLIPKFGAADIVLVGSDPNAMPLTYIVTSLPATGMLLEVVTGQMLTPGDLPHPLPAGANRLRYFPDLGYEGPDHLDFKVSNGSQNSSPASVAFTIGGNLPLYNFSLDVDPGWSREGDWQHGQPQGQQQDPSSGYTGLNVLGYNLAGAYTADLPATYLTTTELDFGNASGTEMRFWRHLGVEQNFFDHATLEVSTNGLDWTLLWANGTQNIADLGWTEQVFDVSATVDGDSAVQFRWGMGPTDGSAQFHGWNIDDVQFFGSVPLMLGDIDRDGDRDTIDYRALAACLAGTGQAPVPPSPMVAQDCLDAFDSDMDGDVDLRELAVFQASVGD